MNKIQVRINEIPMREREREKNKSNKKKTSIFSQSGL